MATQQDVIKTFMKSLDESTQLTAKDAVDEAFNTASNTRFRNMPELIEAFLNDYNSYPKWEDFLREKCGIILDNEDSGSVTGLDMGNTKIKTDASIVPESGSAVQLDKYYREANGKNFRDVTNSGGAISFTRKGLTVKVPNYDKLIKSADSGNEEAKRKLIVINGLYTWWIENSLQLIEDSYGANFGFTDASSAATRDIELDLSKTDASVAAVEYANGKLYLYVYMNHFTELDETDHNGKSPIGELLDSYIAHEMTHGVMNVNITGIKDVKYAGDLGRLVSEGMAEITRGIDGTRLNQITRTMSKPEIIRTVLNAPYNTKYFDKDTEKEAQYCLGYVLLRYLAQQCATENSYAVALGSVGKLKVNNDRSK